MEKKYSSPCMKFTVNIKKDGKPFAVVFADYDREERRRTIIVSDEDTQKQMEASDAFNTYFHLDHDYHPETETVEAEIPQEIEKEIPKSEAKEFDTLAEAKKYLAAQGVVIYPSMNKAKAIEAAKAKQIQLNIKN